MSFLKFDDDASAQLDAYQLMNEPMHDSEAEYLAPLIDDGKQELEDHE